MVMSYPADGLPDQGGTGAVEIVRCRMGHARPARARGGWMCPRCGLRIMPMTATECFEGHARPEDSEQLTVWVCPDDGELVYPGDVNVLYMLEANKDHALREDLARYALEGGTGIDRNLLMHFFGVPPVDEYVTRGADPNERLIEIGTPILAGFSLAAIVTIGTTAAPGPGAYPAMACFAGSAVLMLFSLQILAIERLHGLKGAKWPKWATFILSELGLLAFLVGLGLFLWLKPLPPAAVAGFVVVGLAVICDLALLATAWYRRKQWGKLGELRLQQPAWVPGRCRTSTGGDLSRISRRITSTTSTTRLHCPARHAQRDTHARLRLTDAYPVGHQRGIQRSHTSAAASGPAVSAWRRQQAPSPEEAGRRHDVMLRRYCHDCDHGPPGIRIGEAAPGWFFATPMAACPRRRR